MELFKSLFHVTLYVNDIKIHTKRNPANAFYIVFIPRR